MIQLINFLPILTYLLLAIGIGFLFTRIFHSIIICVLIIILTVVSAFALLEVLKSLPPSLVKISILSPNTDEIFLEQKITVSGTISPTNSSVTLLVHPEDTDLWWVQGSAEVINKSGNWQGVCYIGTDSMGVDRNYDIIALGTNSYWFYDALLGRTLIAGHTIKVLPLVNKSEIVVVRRGKE